MKDEIKEILDRIETASEIFDCLLKPEECTELLDYITNLQHQISLMEEDIRESKEINGELQQDIKNYVDIVLYQRKTIDNLQQENGTLQENNQAMQEEMARVWEENERLKDGYCKFKEKCNEEYADCTKEEYITMSERNMKLSLEKEDYKSRCEKAIEYIKANCSYDEDTNMCCDDLFCGDVDDLLNILQNGSDSQ